MNIAEKIETIVDCHTDGTFGSFAKMENGRFLVTVDGREFEVWTDCFGWNVKSGYICGRGSTVLDAAHNLLD